jgi:hypothetical protein
VFGQTVPEGALSIGFCPAVEGTSCRRINFTSSDLTLDGVTHGLSAKSFLSAASMWKEDIRLGDLVVFEFKLDPAPSSIVDANVLVSLVVSAAGDAQMYENQPVRLLRDGKWRQYQLYWKYATWRRVYKSCQSDGKPGVCLPAAQCRAAGRTPLASVLSLTGGVNKVSGCHRITDPDVQCCVGFEDPPGAMVSLPVNSSVPNEYVGVRIYSGDKTGVAQSLLMRPVSLCNDACGGVCNVTSGFVCDVPSKTCMCMNQYPWVLGPNNQCYQTSNWAGRVEYPCAMCPRSSMFTYYNVSRPTVATNGATRLKCFYSRDAKKRDVFRELDADQSPPSESCCKYKCDCDDGFVRGPPGDLALTPGLLHCVPKTTTQAPAGAPAATPAPTTAAGDCQCGPDQICLFGQCSCDSTKGWTEDVLTSTPTRTNCVSECSNCLLPTRCAQPPTRLNATCACAPEWTLATIRVGLLSCQKQCAVPCTASEECSFEEGQCICRAGFERVTPTAPCTAQVFVVDGGGDTGSASDREKLANACGVQCSEREDCNAVTKKCECRVPPYFVDDKGACVSRCDKCMSIARSECDETGECVCREGYTLASNACVPIQMGTAFVPSTSTVMIFFTPDELSDTDVIIIIAAVGGSIAFLVVVGVIVCIVVIMRARRQREQLHANPMYKHSIEMRQSAVAATRDSGAKRAPQSAYGNFDAASFSAAATARAPQSAYQPFDAAGGRDGDSIQSYSDGRAIASYSDGRNVEIFVPPPRASDGSVDGRTSHMPRANLPIY